MAWGRVIVSQARQAPSFDLLRFCGKRTTTLLDESPKSLSRTAERLAHYAQAPVLERHILTMDLDGRSAPRMQEEVQSHTSTPRARCVSDSRPSPHRRRIPNGNSWSTTAWVRLTSVCEVTSASGSGVCSQNASQPTGYWTTYAYDTLDDRTGGNAEMPRQPLPADRRETYAYDLLRRLTSETNPETGDGGRTRMTAYRPACFNFGDNQSGNLLARTDANGKHDLLPRRYSTPPSGRGLSPALTQLPASVSGTMSRPTEGKTVSAPSGVTVSNVKGAV